jgi:hypothetical protein
MTKARFQQFSTGNESDCAEKKKEKDNSPEAKEARRLARKRQRMREELLTADPYGYDVDQLHIEGDESDGE